MSRGSSGAMSLVHLMTSETLTVFVSWRVKFPSVVDHIDMLGAIIQYAIHRHANVFLWNKYYTLWLKVVFSRMNKSKASELWLTNCFLYISFILFSTFFINNKLFLFFRKLNGNTIISLPVGLFSNNINLRKM